MDEIPETRDSLLIRVADARDQAAWEQFARIYRPVVYNVARMRGLQDADAQDVAQQVLLSVSKALPTWERRDESTRFRHWLCRMARNATINTLTRQPKDRAVGGPLLPVEIPEVHADSDLDSRLVREYRRQLFRQAAEHVRTRADATTWNRVKPVGSKFNLSLRPHLHGVTPKNSFETSRSRRSHSENHCPIIPINTAIFVKLKRHYLNRRQRKPLLEWYSSSLRIKLDARFRG